MPTLSEQLATHLAEFDAAPDVFVGSGLSRRYLSLPTWSGLLESYCAELPHPFAYYRSRANGHLPAAAALIAQDFHTRWFADAAFEPSRREFEKNVQTTADPLKYEIAKSLKSITLPTLAPELTDELSLLQSATIDAFITTNWDPLLERLFPTYRVFTSQEHLLFSPTTGIAEIYKIHGCSTDPHSLILTDSDYRDFAGRYPYLASKLLTSFVEHPTVFIGYSFSDDNIQSLIRSLASCLGTAHIGKLADRLLFVEWGQGAAGTMAKSTIFADGTPVPMWLIRTDSFAPIFEAMGTIRRKLPARLLRKMKEQVYDFVRTNDPRDQLHVVNLDDEADDSEIEVVYGVGVKEAVASLGLRGIQRADVINDVVFEDQGWHAEEVLLQAMPELLKGSPLLPTFKYLRAAGRINGTQLKVDDLDDRIIRASQLKHEGCATKSYRSQRNEVDAKYDSLQELVDAEGVDRAVHLIPLLAPNKVNTAELLEFIRKHYEYFRGRGSGHESNMKRLVCLYDLLEHGPTLPG